MDSSSNTQKAMKGMSTLTLITIVTGVVEMVYFSIMSRFLTREEFGLFAAITAVSTIFTNISEAGIGSALIHRKDLNDEYKNTSFSLSILIGIFVTSAFLASSGLLSNLVIGSEVMRLPLMIISVTIFFSGLNSVYLGVMRRNLEFLKSGLITLTSAVISSLVAVVMAINGFGVYSIITKAILGSFLISFISALFTKNSFHFSIKKEYVKNIVNYGGWLTFGVMIRTLADQVDRLMMSRLLSVKALGAYNRPKDFILGIGGQVSGIFDTVLFPVLSSIQDEKERMHRSFNVSQYNLNLFSMLLAMVFICNTDLIIRVFFGQEWMDLRVLFQIISVTLLFSFNSRLGDCYFRSLGIVKQYSFFRLIELFVNVVAILVGYHWGIVGVGVAFMISAFLQTFIKLIYISRKIGVPYTEFIDNVISGWRTGLYFLPIVILNYLLVPRTLKWEIAMAFIFIMVSIIVFIAVPSLLGDKYKNHTYIQLKEFITAKIPFFTKEKSM